MKEEGLGNPSLCDIWEGHNKNLYIYGEDVKQLEDESWGIVIFERGIVREMVM